MPGDDAEVLSRLRARDERAFAEIVREWSPVLLRVAGSFVSTHTSAEECVQEAWLVVIRGLDGFEGLAAAPWAVGTSSTSPPRPARRPVVVMTTLEEDSGPTTDLGRFRAPGELWAGGWTEPEAPREWEPSPLPGQRATAHRWRRSLGPPPDCPRPALGRPPRSAQRGSRRHTPAIAIALSRARNLGTMPYQRRVSAGHLLRGLGLTRTGRLSGRATQRGHFRFSVRVADSSQPTMHAKRRLTLIVR